MKLVTRKNAKVDRVACPWLIRRFVDQDGFATASLLMARPSSSEFSEMAIS